jgi:esterase/lipase
MPELGFGILISCPGSTLLESDLNYWKNRARVSLSEHDLDLSESLQRSVFLYMAGEKSKEELTEALEASKNKTWRSHVWVQDLDSVKIDRKLSYTPIPYLQQLKQPILVIKGSSDEIIPVNSWTKIKDLTEKNNSKNNYVLLQNADHAMMYQGKSDFPYWPSLHPAYRNTMIKWLDQF